MSKITCLSHFFDTKRSISQERGKISKIANKVLETIYPRARLPNLKAVAAFVTKLKAIECWKKEPGEKSNFAKGPAPRKPVGLEVQRPKGAEWCHEILCRPPLSERKSSLNVSHHRMIVRDTATGEAYCTCRSTSWSSAPTWPTQSIWYGRGEWPSTRPLWVS